MSIGKVLQQMPMPKIGSIKSAELPGVTDNKGSPFENFGDMVTKGVAKVDGAIKEYEAVSNKFANGESINLHELILKGEHAEVSLRMMSLVKSKVVNAYQEIMRMSV